MSTVLAVVVWTTEMVGWVSSKEEPEIKAKRVVVWAINKEMEKQEDVA